MTQIQIYGGRAKWETTESKSPPAITSATRTAKLLAQLPVGALLLASSGPTLVPRLLFAVTHLPPCTSWVFRLPAQHLST
jgi:hypothetical protein